MLKKEKGVNENTTLMLDLQRKRIRKIKSAFNAKAKANKALREAISLFEKGIIVSNKIPYFNYFIEYYFDNYIVLNTKYSTKYLYIKIIDVHIKKDLDFYRIDQLTSQILQDYLDKMMYIVRIILFQLKIYLIHP